jgi:hypothetical protein
VAEFVNEFRTELQPILYFLCLSHRILSLSQTLGTEFKKKEKKKIPSFPSGGAVRAGKRSFLSRK